MTIALKLTGRMLFKDVKIQILFKIVQIVWLQFDLTKLQNKGTTAIRGIQVILGVPYYSLIIRLLSSPLQATLSSYPVAKSCSERIRMRNRGIIGTLIGTGRNRERP